MDRLAFALARLTLRERALLGMLGAVGLPLAIAFLAVLPMLDARNVARHEAQQTEALRSWVASRVAELPPEGAEAESDSAPPEPIGLSGLEQSLVEAGLRGAVRQLANAAAGGVELDFDPVPFDGLTGWLFATSRIWGYDIAAFRIERDAPGLVTAGFTLMPAD